MSKTPATHCSLLRKSMYKYKTPPWREVYKMRCLERIKLGRQKLLDRFRGLEISNQACDKIDEVMTQEWEELHKEHNLPSLCSGNFGGQVLQNIDDDDEHEEITTFLEIIRKELLEEEKMMIHEHEKNVLFENLASDCHDDDSVVCPICKKNQLLLNRSVLFCPCGLHIDTEQDCITLAYVKRQLEFGLSSHNSHCSADVNFTVSSVVGMSNLYILCSVCDFMYVVV